MENNTAFSEQIEKNIPEPAPAQQAAPQPVPQSNFDGNTLQLIGWRLLGSLLCLITFGIGTPWVNVWIMRWETKHTTVNGRRLYFDGTGLQLLGMYLLCGFLTLITVGIYAIFIPVKMRKWRAKHTRLATDAEAAAAAKKLPGWANALIVVLVIALVLALVGGAAMVLLYRYVPDVWQDQAVRPNEDGGAWGDGNNIGMVIGPDGNVIIIQPGGNEDGWIIDGSNAGDQAEYVDPVDYYVTPDGGLWLRGGPNYESDKLVVMPQNTLVVPLYWDDGWAYVDYDGTYGWCLGDYISTQPAQSGGSSGNSGSSGDSGSTSSGGYTSAQVQQAINDANAIIESYRGRATSQGRTSMTSAEVTGFFEKAAGIADRDMWFAGWFDTAYDYLQVTDADLYMDYMYLQVEDSSFRTIEDICDFYFSYFADDYAISLLRGKVFMLDGKMYAHAMGYGVAAVYVSHRFEVAEKPDCFLVTTYVTECWDYTTGVLTEFSMTHRCVKEDGIWVWESTGTIYT